MGKLSFYSENKFIEYLNRKQKKGKENKKVNKHGLTMSIQDTGVTL